jgi:hypothetical protein
MGWPSQVLAVVVTLTLACDRPPVPVARAEDTGRAAAVQPDTVVRRVVRVYRRPSAMQRVTKAVYARRAHEALDSTLVIRVLDQRGLELPAVAVRWTLVAGGDGAQLKVLNERTDSLGESRATFIPGRSASVQTVAAEVADVGRIDFTFSVPVATVSLVMAQSTIWAGDAEIVGVVLADDGGTDLAGGAVSWGTTDSTVLRVSVADSLHARVTGGLAGGADLVAWIGMQRGRTRMTVRPVLTGRFDAVDGASNPPVRLTIGTSEWQENVAVDGGEFTSRIDLRGESEVDVRARFDSPDVHDAHIRIRNPRDLQRLRIAMVPTRWRIDAGAYAGQAVPIDAAQAMRRVEGRAPFWRLAPLSGRGTRTLLGWDARALPIRIAFARDRSREPITEQDSIAFWATARQMEQDLGATLFAPAVPVADSAAYVGVEITAQSPAGHTFVSWTQNGDVEDGVLLFRTAATLRDPHVVTHELLHLLGFGHTVSWPSVARPVGGKETRLTPEDVAYVQLATRLREMKRRIGSLPGVPVVVQ